MKKTIAIVLSFVLIATTFAGCSNTVKNEEEIKKAIPLPEQVTVFDFAECIDKEYKSSVFMAFKDNGIKTELKEEDCYECYYFPSDYTACKINEIDIAPERIEVEWTEEGLIESIEIYYAEPNFDLFAFIMKKCQDKIFTNDERWTLDAVTVNENYDYRVSSGNLIKISSKFKIDREIGATDICFWSV